jgi:anaerobic selenocysteine-containing dehydrogenase
MSTIVHHQCTLCEARCGVDVEVDGDRVLRIVGDTKDPISKGHICPKGVALQDIYDDPDRLRRPVKRTDRGWEEIGWDEALDLAADGMRRILDSHGPEALASYWGNPGGNSNGMGAFILWRMATGTKSHYSVASLDQAPHHTAAIEMFGNPMSLPIPDLDRTNHMLMFGANPAVSNGSAMSAPGVKNRFRSLFERGGTLTVVDPRRSETARLATRHVSISPGGDCFLLLGMLNVIFAEGRDKLGPLGRWCIGEAELREVCKLWPAERAAAYAGVDEEVVIELAREFTSRPGSVAYGRLGVCHQTTGSINTWLITALNAVTGNLDSVGGAMFTTPAVDLAPVMRLATRAGLTWRGTRRQRVSGVKDMMFELPMAGLADEILTPGEGQVRGLLVYGGNPVLSSPGGTELDRALEALDFFVSVDFYITETSRHADVILPPVSALQREEVDALVPMMSVRNHIRFSPPALPKGPQDRQDWEILAELAARGGRGRKGKVLGALARASLKFGVNPGDAGMGMSIALGPYGVLRRGPRKGLTLGRVRCAPHGIDLGPLRPNQIGKILATKDRRVRLAPADLIAAVAEATERADALNDEVRDGFDLTLIGRRSTNSSNSWLHNSARLTKGRDRCVARMHPDDAARRGISSDQLVTVRSRVGQVELPVELSDEIRPGVVSIPHGFGHGRLGVGWKHAASKPGVSMNDLTDPALIDETSGVAALNGTRVSVVAVEP